MADSVNTNSLPISQLSIAEQVCLYEACQEVFDLTSKIANQLRGTQGVQDILEGLFEYPAGDAMEQIIKNLKTSKTTDKHEIHLISKILVPYSIEDESLERGMSVLSDLICRLSSLSKAA
jgi:hypothetical protein